MFLVKKEKQKKRKTKNERIYHLHDNKTVFRKASVSLKRTWLRINMSIDYKRSLLVASEKGDLNKVENCLKKVPVDVTDEQNQTALHYAAANGHEVVVMHLIKKGAGLECKNYAEWTPLMFASYYGHLNVVALLVHNKAEININNQRLATPLTCAARCGHKAVIEFLLDNGADCDMNEDKENKPSVTPLMAAAQHGHTSIVSLLLQYGMNVDYQNPDTGYTALMLAAMNGHLEIVELLVKNGSADVNLHNCRNQTAYQLSVIKQRKNVEEYLRERTKKRVRISPSSSNSHYNLIDLAKGEELFFLSNFHFFAAAMVLPSENIPSDLKLFCNLCWSTACYIFHVLF